MTGQMCAKPVRGAARVSFVKRIVAGPGDEARMEDGREGMGCDYPQEIEVPTGHFPVLGDNRGASHDSRFWGPVPAENFVGRRIFTYWSG